MSEISTRKLERRRPYFKVRAGAGVAALAAAGLAAGLVTGVDGAVDRKAQQHYESVERDALDGIYGGEVPNKAWNRVVALHEGAQYRQAPLMVSPNGESANTTIAGTVKKGEVLRLDRPRSYRDEDGTYWFAFNGLNKGGPEVRAHDIGQTYWVNFSELQAQGSDSRALVEVYDYPEVLDAIQGGEQDVPYNIPLVVDGAGNLVAAGKDGGPAIATASNMPATVFEQMVVDERLTLSHGK
jgi:hypothetical protein